MCHRLDEADGIDNGAQLQEKLPVGANRKWLPTFYERVPNLILAAKKADEEIFSGRPAMIWAIS